MRADVFFDISESFKNVVKGAGIPLILKTAERRILKKKNKFQCHERCGCSSWFIMIDLLYRLSHDIVTLMWIASDSIVRQTINTNFSLSKMMMKKNP